MVVFQAQAGIAQSVEHFTRNEGVVSSSLISSLPLTGSGYFEQSIRIFVLYRIFLYSFCTCIAENLCYDSEIKADCFYNVLTYKSDVFLSIIAPGNNHRS